MNVLNIHENLLECLLEMGNYADVQAVLAKYDDISLPKSAAICYTAALLKARSVADKFSADVAGKRGLTVSEMAAVEAIHRFLTISPNFGLHFPSFTKIVNANVCASFLLIFHFHPILQSDACIKGGGVQPSRPKVFAGDEAVDLAA